MGVEIGSAYEQTKRDLVEKINDGSVVVIVANGNAGRCYFCNNQIDGKYLIVLDKDRHNCAVSRYAIDSECFKEY